MVSFAKNDNFAIMNLKAVGNARALIKCGAMKGSLGKRSHRSTSVHVNLCTDAVEMIERSPF